MTYRNKGIPSHQLIGLVYLVDSAYLVSLVQPNNTLLSLADFSSILLSQRRKRNQRYTALISTDPNITGNPSLKNCQNEMG